MINNLINPFLSFLKNHYNHTDTYEFYNIHTKQFELLSYTEPIKNIIFSDLFTVGVLYYILSNL